MNVIIFLYLGVVLCNNLSISYSIGGPKGLRSSSKCSGADEVSSTVYYNWWSGNKVSENKKKAHDALDNISQWLKSNKNGQSYSYNKDNINAVVWSGSMVQNQGLDSNIIKSFKDEINLYGIQNLGYYEYIGGNDPMKSFGIAIDTTGGESMTNLKRALKLWSQGKAYNTNKGYKSINGLSVCFHKYKDRKPITNDKSVGDCNYILVKSGENIATTAKINGESLEGYNPSLNFNNLQVGQPVCSSIGNLPNLKPSNDNKGGCYKYKVNRGDTCSIISSKFYPLSIEDIEKYNKYVYGWEGCNKLLYGLSICLSDGESFNCDKVSSNMIYGYKNVSPKIESNKNKAINAINYFKESVLSSIDTRVFYYNEGNVNAYAWVGQKINNINNIGDNYIKEIKDNGIPDMSYYEYVKSDPTISVGIVIEVKSNKNSIEEIVKLWSSGSSYNINTGSKRITSEFCLIKESNKGFIVPSDVGDCLTFEFSDINNLPLSKENIEYYNPSKNLENVIKGEKLCKSVGNEYEASKECSIYVAKEGDTCESIAKKYNGITAGDIEKYNLNNELFYGCDLIFEGDKICVSG